MYTLIIITAVLLGIIVLIEGISLAINGESEYFSSAVLLFLIFCSISFFYLRFA